MMVPATPGQKLLIDARRHEQCKHPRAQDMDGLEILFCKRCGMSYIEGKLDYDQPLLEEHERPGEFHASSYMAKEHGGALNVDMSDEKQEGPKLMRVQVGPSNNGIK